MFRQVLIWGVNEGYLDKVPGNNVKVGGVKKLNPGELRDAYSPDQLTKIFGSPSTPATSRKMSVIKRGTSVCGTDISGFR